MQLGNTYQFQHLNHRGHLWVVISRPTASRSLVMVNFTSAKPGCDRTCVIAANEHPFVHHETVVSYVHARNAPIDELLRAVAQGIALANSPVTPALLARIQAGAIGSRHVSTSLQREVRSSMAAAQAPTAGPTPKKEP